MEFLGCGFEGLLAMRENWEKIREEDKQERLEIRRQLNELVETVREITTRSDRDESINDNNHTVNDDDTKKICNPRNREERWRKLKIPVFTGEDAFGWTIRVERYFKLKGMNDPEKLQAVMVAMEGKLWWLWRERR